MSRETFSAGSGGGGGITAQQKLIWLGLNNRTFQQNPFQSQIEELKNLYSFSEIQDKFENDWGSFADYAGDVNAENRSDSNGIEDYQSWQKKLVDIYGDPENPQEPTDPEISDAWDPHEDAFINEYVGWPDFENEFRTNTALTGQRQDESGEDIAGVRVHDTTGVTKNGDTVPAGSVEVFGRQVHFSQSDEARQGAGTGGTEDPNIVFRNIAVNPTTTPNIGAEITVSAEVKNDTSYTETVIAPLKENGTVTDSQTLELMGNEIQEVSFTLEKPTNQLVTVKIGDSDSITVNWVPAGIAEYEE